MPSAAWEIPWTPVKIGWLSGVSRPRTRALSPLQEAFVRGLPGDEAWKLTTNFPYGRRRKPEAPYRETPIVFASGVNALRFLAASQPIRRPSRQAAWEALRQSCDRLLLVTCSSGSQIAHSLESRYAGPGPSVGASPGATLSILSLGAVDWGLHGLDRVSVRGASDRVRVPFQGPADHIIPGVGHMDYARSGAVQAVAAEWVRAHLRNAGPMARGV